MGRTTLWDIVRAEPELSALRELLANDVPWVAATLDAKKLADDADRETAFPPGAPYDPDAPGLVPLLDDNTGFVPRRHAVRAERRRGGSAADVPARGGLWTRKRVSSKKPPRPEELRRA
jgi:hypothetical protein